MKTALLAGAAAAVLSLAMAGAALAADITGAGSTFIYPVFAKWADTYKTKTGTGLNYQSIGSGGGIKQVEAKTVTFGATDKPLSDAELSKNGLVQFPMIMGGIVPIVNIVGVKPGDLVLDAPTLAGIFMGKITKWNDAAIKADNPTATLPDTAIATFHRSDGSGTTNVLSGFLDATAKSVWTLGVNKEFTWPSGQGAVGSSGVVQGVKNTNGGITYAEITYAQQAQLPTAAVKGAKGGYVSISADTVAKSINSGFEVTGTAPNLAGALSYTKMTGYPISTVSYVLVCSTYADSAEGSLVKDYLTYAAGDGQAEADPLGFAPLPAALDQKVLSSVATIG